MKANNVIVLMSDEHSAAVMGAYGNAYVKTPALDRLANSGVRFDRAYTPSPICISARASFATATAVFEHRCWSSAEPYFGQQQSWMQRLRDQGHAVVSIGKLHYRSAQDDVGFSDQILPMYVANNGRGWPQGLQRRPLADFPEAAEMAAHIGPGETDYTRYDRAITAAAVAWLEQRAADYSLPWVLFVSFICPHYPLSAPRQFYEIYTQTDLPVAYDRDAESQLRHPVLDAMRQFWNYADYFDAARERLAVKNYYALCSFLDNNVQQVLAALQRSGQADNTQVIYTSDHGEMLGNHGIWGKCFMYEDSVRIPLTYSGPGIAAAVNNTPVSLIDIGATIEQAVLGSAASAAESWRSKPLQTYVLTPDNARAVVSEYHDGGSPCGVFMLRQGPWKYVYFCAGQPALLFNLETDPQELSNRIDDPNCTDVVAALRSQLWQIVDPEEANRQAFCDQAKMIAKLGGIDAIKALPSFNHTPVASG